MQAERANEEEQILLGQTQTLNRPNAVPHYSAWLIA